MGRGAPELSPKESERRSCKGAECSGLISMCNLMGAWPDISAGFITVMGFRGLNIQRKIINKQINKLVK